MIGSVFDSVLSVLNHLRTFEQQNDSVTSNLTMDKAYKLVQNLHRFQYEVGGLSVDLHFLLIVFLSRTLGL